MKKLKLNLKLKMMILFVITFGFEVSNAQKYLPVVNWDGPTPAAPQPKPGYLEEVTDPVYGTHFKRVADYAIWEADINLINENETRHYYSLRPVFNRNSTFYIVNWQQIRIVGTNEFIGRANEIAGGKFDNATWSKVDPYILYGTMSNNFVALNILTGEVDTIVVLEGFNTGPRDRLYMDNQQAIAGDDKYIVISDVPTLGQQIAVIDIQNRTILSKIEDAYHDQVFTIRVTDKTETDSSIRMNVGISLKGEYIVLEGGNGTFMYDKYFNYIRKLSDHGHADFGLDEQGRDVLISICPAKYEVLETGEIYDLLGGTYACGHANASSNYLQPGWAYLSINRDDNDDGDNGLYQGYEIVAVKIEPSGKIVRKIIHPHNTGYGLVESAYGVPNPDGSLLMFNSAWDDFASNAEIDAYMAELTTPDSSEFTLEVQGKGKVISSNADISGISNYYYKGYNILLTAVDTALGFSFSNWGGDISSTDNPVTVNLDTDKHVIANFNSIPVYSLVTSVLGEGRVSSAANGEYNERSEVRITAFPNWGYEFLRWEGDLTGTENPVTISIDSNINITAVFSGTTGIFDDEESGSDNFGLKCYPNPFKDLITIQYELTEPAKVKLSVIDMSGKEIVVLVNEKQNSGIHRIEWEGDKNGKAKLAAGIYISKLDIENSDPVYKKMILNK